MRVTTHYWLSLACSTALLGVGSNAFLSSRADISSELGAQLSKEANIFFPNAEEFAEATDRWSDYYRPNFTVVVQVAEEEDVANTVRFANSHKIPFLAVNDGHGDISSLGRMQDGIQIWLRNLNSIEISEDGRTATVGGGVRSFELMQTLFEKGKQTVHGVCECTSYLGPGLGGGHGALQGRHGLVSDQYLSLRLVTANGEIIEVSPDNKNKDLWWAMQGAGHNFGIVTSITSKIYDLVEDGIWAWEQLVFTHDQVEEVFELFNDLADIQPPDFLVWSYILRAPPMDPENPVILSHFLRGGVASIDPELIQPFRDLSGGAAANANATGLYTDIPTWIGTDLKGKGCTRDGSKIRFPIGFSRYNAEAQREFFDAFAEGTAGDSPLNSSIVLLEQYSMQGVQAVPEESTAFPHRQDDLLISPNMQYASPADAETEYKANVLGDTLRSILLKGTASNELRAYVNYAAGNEGSESWYGYETWRQERLSELKRNAANTPPTVPSPVPSEAPFSRDASPYYFEGGLRRVHPYHYTYNTYCKERWRDRTLLDIFTSEFRDREAGYYQKALESGKVRVNGQSASPDTILKNGQYISHTLHRHEPPVTGNDIGIIHESNDLLAIDKPAGVPVHSTGRYHYNSVIEILKYKYEDKFIPRPCNRLDRLTSGVMFVGKTAKGADTMAVKLRARSVQKEYVARVKGKFPDGVIVVDQPIMSVAPKVGLNRVRATGKEAKTKFRRLAYYPPPSVPAHSSSTEEPRDPNARPATPPPSYINENEGYSVVHCFPLTGRTHQIRVHLQFLGHPISNDPIYSNRRVFGPELGKDDATADYDDAIVDRLMAMGRTELPETVSYRTHFTTPPILPKGTDASVVEAIMSREHEAAVEAYQKRKGERLSGKKCDECGTELYTDPGVHELGIFLHAVSYSDSDGEWSYRSKMPSWALPPADLGVDGPTEVPEWQDVSENEEIVYGSGEVPDIGNDDAPASRGVTALVEGVGLVDISEARQVEERERTATVAAPVPENGD
ncbi:hypothetical protein BJY01DRAFT_237701 [Aspergillus pseudoustus]|uniref:FAD-binding PCMH-type domain-containing protein n=1 Tax=Aspergillus pseudoustus TaxID=1810923 RepID=A0ABR4JCV7_9EURO